MNQLEKLLCAELRRNLAGGGRPRVPAGGDLLWRWFADLSASRSFGATGPNPISYAEIAAYARVTGWSIEARHISVLHAMDREILGHFCLRAHVDNPGVKSLPPISKTPMSAGMLDAMFG